MKKLGLTLLAGVLSLGILAGCNGEEENEEMDDQQEEQDMDNEEEGNDE